MKSDELIVTLSDITIPMIMIIYAQKVRRCVMYPGCATGGIIMLARILHYIYCTQFELMHFFPLSISVQ